MTLLKKLGRRRRRVSGASGWGCRRHGGAHGNSPGDHPPELAGLVRRADGNAAEFGDRGEVLPCGEGQRFVFLINNTARGAGPEPLPHPLTPACLGRSPIQVLTRTPWPGPDELPRTACPSRVAFLGMAMGWNSVFRGDFLQVFWVLLISYMTPWKNRGPGDLAPSPTTPPFLVFVVPPPVVPFCRAGARQR